MNYLVDTQIFLWILFSPQNLSKKILSILHDQESALYVSAITFWEISLKFSLGKLDLIGILPDKLPGVARQTGLDVISLNTDTASSFYKLPRRKNKDPFDRMLAWQAICRDYILLTKDKGVSDYRERGLKMIW